MSRIEPKTWTAGPWEVYDRGIGWEIHDPNGDNVNSGFRETFTREDAYLIAAAPELYEVLEAIAALDDGDERFAWKHEALFNAARAALAKACPENQKEEPR
jgi:hypothetical protein